MQVLRDRASFRVHVLFFDMIGKPIHMPLRDRDNTYDITSSRLLPRIPISILLQTTGKKNTVLRRGNAPD